MERSAPHNLILSLVLDQSVQGTRVAGDDLLIYFGGSPEGSLESARTLWIEPPWRYVANGIVTLSSSELGISSEDFDSKLQYEKEFQRLCAKIAPLHAAKLSRAIVDPGTKDLDLTFSGEQRVQTFCCGAPDLPVWSFVDVEANKLYEIFYDRIEESPYSTKKLRNVSLKLISSTGKKFEGE